MFLSTLLYFPPRYLFVFFLHTYSLANLASILTYSLQQIAYQDCLEIFMRYAPMRISDKAVASQMANTSASLLPNLPMVTIVRALRTYDMNFCSDPNFYRSVAEEVDRRLAEISVGNAVILINSFARRRYFPKNNLFSKLNSIAFENLHECDLLQMVYLLVANATFRERNDAFLSRCDEYICRDKMPFPSFCISGILWAFASLAKKPSSVLMKSLLEDIETSIKHSSTQDICSIAWSLVNLQHFHMPSLDILCSISAKRLLEGNFQAIDVRQLQSVSFWVSGRGIP